MVLADLTKQNKQFQATGVCAHLSVEHLRTLCNVGAVVENVLIFINSHCKDVFGELNQKASEGKREFCEAPESDLMDTWAGETAWINCDWDLLNVVAQRLESEPEVVATVLCPYFLGQLEFAWLQRLASQVVVMDFDQSWVLRTEPSAFGLLGPASWKVSFLHIPARPRGR
jgi:hypothetical protein